MNQAPEAAAGLPRQTIGTAPMLQMLIDLLFGGLVLSEEDLPKKG